MPREFQALNSEPSEPRLEHVLQRELGDARPPLCGRDGSEGSAAGDGIGDARVTEFSAIEHVEVFRTEVKVRLAEYGEGTNDRGVPVCVSGTAERPLHHVAKAGAGAALDGNRESCIASMPMALTRSSTR